MSAVGESKSTGDESAAHASVIAREAEVRGGETLRRLTLNMEKFRGLARAGE